MKRCGIHVAIASSVPAWRTGTACMLCTLWLGDGPGNRRRRAAVINALRKSASSRQLQHV